MSIIAQVKGGLGNQLFIYAMGRAMALRNSTPLLLDVLSGFEKDNFGRSFLLDRFNIKAGIASRFDSYSYPGGRAVRKGLTIANSCLPLQMRTILNERSATFDPDAAILRQKNLYLMGYWQSPRYFEEFSNEIRSELTLKEELDPVNKELEREIMCSDSVSVHIRQDNISYRLDESYYRKAFEIIAAKSPNAKYFVFSDSPELAMGLLGGLPAKLVNINDSYTCYKDLQLMSRCRHHIVANSTFSWWGAWLSNNTAEGIVAVPESISRFNCDILPKHWREIPG